MLMRITYPLYPLETQVLVTTWPNATVRNVERDSDNTLVDIELDGSPSTAPHCNWYEFTLQSECSGVEKESTFTAHAMEIV